MLLLGSSFFGFLDLFILREVEYSYLFEFCNQTLVGMDFILLDGHEVRISC